MTLHALIAKLEKLDGPSWELDREILSLTLPTTFMGSKVLSWFGDGPCLGCNTENGMKHLDAVPVPHYTSSLDAALTLVPEGSYGFAYPWFYSQYSRYEKPCVFWRAAIHKPIWEKATPTLAGEDWFERHECDTDAPSPAIALCIAALRARAAA